MLKSFQQLQEEYNEVYKSTRAKRVRIYTIITSILAGITVLSLFLKNFEHFFTYIMYIAIGILVIAVVIMIIDLASGTNKSLYNIVYPNVIEEINFNDDSNITLDVLTKENEFIKIGGLFPRLSSKDIKFHINYTTDDGVNISIYDAYIYTQSNNGRVVHFDGIYYVLKIPNNVYFQLRSNGSPKLKGTKFKKFQTDPLMKEYVKEDEEERIDSKYYSLFNFLKEDIPKRKIYIGGIENELHIGITKYNLFRKLNELTDSDYSRLKSHIYEILEFGKTIANKITF